VVHERERNGGYVVGVEASNPYFGDIRELWKLRYPSDTPPPASEAEGMKISADFATQFPNDT
jgi:hypothetical protein